MGMSEVDVETVEMRQHASASGAFKRLLISAVIAFAGLTLYGWNDLSAEDFALRKDDVHTTESAEGVPFTAASVPLMKASLEQHAAVPHPLMLWLGNSQLHTINQMAHGDHLAAYWLRKDIGEQSALPLTFSLPNANFQEEYVLATYALERAKFKLIILALVFDDLREDDLRDDFTTIMDSNLKSDLSKSSIGKDVLARFEAENQKPADQLGGFSGFGQLRIETAISAFLDRQFPLWAKRPNLRTHVLTDLYFARNYVFGIKSTTVRHVIPLRYKRNMAALAGLLDKAAANDVPVLGYVAPLRPNVTSPYDPTEYRLWKSEAEGMFLEHGFAFVNLESIVPGDVWGTYDPNSVDFMHFRGEGHRILARALAPYVTQQIAK